MLAHYTNGNVLKVKKKLGHKSIFSTMKYIHLIHFEESEFKVATAENVEEAKQKLVQGLRYRKAESCFSGVRKGSPFMRISAKRWG